MIFTAFVEGSVFFDNVPVALDAADNIYIAGSTFGNTFGDDTFKPTPGAFQGAFGGKTDAWVAKLNSSGTSLVYATFLGGSGDERIGGIAVDSSGNAYVTGTTTSKNFPVSAGVFQHDCKLKSDDTCASAFVTKLNALGTRVLYSSYLGGHGTQSGEGIALNPSGNAFVVGQTDAKDFPTTAGSAQPVPAGAQDAFVVQVSSSGSHLNYSTFLGGAGADGGHAIALDSFGNAFVAGRTQSANFPVKNAFQPRCSGGCVFVSKLNTSGRLVYSTFLGSGAGPDFGTPTGGMGIAVTPAGEAYVTGEPGPNFPITQNAFQRVQGPAGAWKWARWQYLHYQVQFHWTANLFQLFRRWPQLSTRGAGPKHKCLSYRACEFWWPYPGDAGRVSRAAWSRRRRLCSKGCGAMRFEYGQSFGNDLFACERQHGGITGEDHCRHNRRDSGEADADLPGRQKDF